MCDFQAIFRLFRIVYTTHRWIQHYRVYIMLVPIQSTSILLLLSLLVVVDSIEYMPSVYFCTIPFKNIAGMLWALLIVYGIPLFTLIIIYLRITIYIHRSSNRRPYLIRRRQKRDFLVIRRILSTVLIMMGLGIPTLVLFMLSIITGHEHRLAQHIQWFTIALSMAGLHVFTLVLTSQTQRMIIPRYWRKHLASVSRDGESSRTMSRIPCNVSIV